MLAHIVAISVVALIAAALIFLPKGRQKGQMVLTSALAASAVFAVAWLKHSGALVNYADALKLAGLVIGAFLSSMFIGFVIRQLHRSRHEGCRPILRAMFIDALIGGPVIAALPMVVPPALGEQLLMAGSLLSIIPIAVIVMARRRSRYEY